MKKVLYILMLILSLYSCWSDKQEITSDNNSKSWTISNDAKSSPANTTLDNKENEKLSNIKLHINEIPYEERQIFKDLEKAIENRDKSKETEILKKINEEKISKEKTLNRAEMSWDVDESTKIKNVLKFYDLILN